MPAGPSSLGTRATSSSQRQSHDGSGESGSGSDGRRGRVSPVVPAVDDQPVRDSKCKAAETGMPQKRNNPSRTAKNKTTSDVGVDPGAPAPAPAEAPARKRPAKQKEPEPRKMPDFDKLLPLGRPGELPTFPSTGKCQWSYDPQTRVVLAKFCLGQDEDMHPNDYSFLREMMEWDDISVVSEGLAEHLTESWWNPEYVCGVGGDEWCHQVRRFSRQIVPEPELAPNSLKSADGDGGEIPTKCFVTHKEERGDVSMKLSSFFEYLTKRAARLDHIAAIREGKGLDPINPTGPDDRVGRVENDEEELFKFTSHDGEATSVNVVDDVLYLTDHDMGKLLPSLHEDLLK